MRLAPISFLRKHDYRGPASKTISGTPVLEAYKLCAGLVQKGIKIHLFGCDCRSVGRHQHPNF